MHRLAPRRAVVVGLAAPLLVLATALPAAAHVTVHPDTAVAGATDTVLAFRVPNESDTAHTVKVKLFLPTDTPLLGVRAASIPGWHVTLHSSRLPRPVTTDDGPVRSAVSRVTWSGGRIGAGTYQDFDLDVGQLPESAGSLAFKAVQTYSDGSVVRWIETAASGAAEPTHPAPVLRLIAPVSKQVAASSDDDGGADRGLAIAALALAVVALWLSIARPRRR